ncbi:hypothetical protein LZ31DRAFT_540305 [Colletotrichum somersetense]|nr:hypothetical protein LZ31DRAFT_540305 [Colletotrichum somersetense]
MAQPTYVKAFIIHSKEDLIPKSTRSLEDEIQRDFKIKTWKILGHSYGVIIDEAHDFENPQTLSFEAVEAVKPGMEWLLVVSGTFMLGRWDDCWAFCPVRKRLYLFPCWSQIHRIMRTLVRANAQIQYHQAH